MGHISSKKILPLCQFGSTNKSGDISRSVLGAGQSTLSTLFIDLNCSLTPFKNVLTSIAAIFCTISKYHLVQCVWWWYQCDIFMGSHRSGQTERWAILSVAINSTYPDTLSRKRGNIFPFIPIVGISPIFSHIFLFFFSWFGPFLLHFYNKWIFDWSDNEVTCWGSLNLVNWFWRWGLIFLVFLQAAGLGNFLCSLSKRWIFDRSDNKVT